uniref:Uncharacterized protein n=1 Tax=Caenorhabditis japonica TaxID=281687 RepID=A0A8R1DM79_CAEJA
MGSFDESIVDIGDSSGSFGRKYVIYETPKNGRKGRRSKAKPDDSYEKVGNVARKLWKELNADYKKHLSRNQKASSGSGALPNSTFMFAQHMEFLDGAAHKKRVNNTYIVGSQDHLTIELESSDFSDHCLENMITDTPKRKKVEMMMTSIPKDRKSLTRRAIS